MPLGSYTLGNGNITTSTSSNAVTGINTNFLTQLQVGAVIGNIGNVFIGYVSNLISNTSLTLSTNANLNVSNQYFNYKALTANAPSYVYTTAGTITANNLSQIVTGNNTHFITDLSYGDTLYYSNLSIANASGPNVVIGKVELITSNTSLYLSSNALANVTNVQYWNVPVSYNSSTIYGGPGNSPATPNVVAGLHLINSTMFNWVQSGLIPNTAVVNNYHPPIRDSVTGILVNLPASIYKKTGNSVSNAYTLGTSINYTSSDYIVIDFDAHQKVFGTDASYVRSKLHNSSTLADLALNGDTESYTSAIKNIIPTTSADRAAQSIGANVARVTDNQTLAQEYFSQETPLDALYKFPQNFTSNQDLGLRAEPQGMRKLVTTGAPIAIPGMINAVAGTFMAANTAWTPPQYQPTVVNINIGNVKALI